MVTPLPEAAFLQERVPPGNSMPSAKMPQYAHAMRLAGLSSAALLPLLHGV
jgi:hypothetical protein